MATAIIYGAPGSGKTINATRLPGKSLLLSSDNSALVLNNFERPNLTIQEVKSFKEFLDAFEASIAEKQYDNVIIDCLTDIIDARTVELRVKGFSGDIRQHYLDIYSKVKDLVRRAAYSQTNVVFTCWDDITTKTLPTGEIVNYVSPMLPAKIKNSVCGLCNVVAYVATAMNSKGERQWYFTMEGSDGLMAKDQMFMRKNCLPENLFTKPEAKK